MRGSCGRQDPSFDSKEAVVERIVERPGALDVHKASVTACVRIWRERELDEQIAELSTTVHGLLALRDWLEALGVRQVVMEATGVYWRPVVRHEALFDRVG
jgi:transposase